jgi:hypothetical protein
LINTEIDLYHSISRENWKWQKNTWTRIRD